jgi:general L-amino acid transport system substrate-binding protein
MRLRLAALVFLCLAACSEPPPAKPKPAEPAKSAVVATPAASPTLEAVRKRGWLACGVHEGLAGFAYPDVRGTWRGFDADICRAIAAAVLGDAAKVRFLPLSAQDRLAALKDGRVDVLSRNTSWTLTRDADFDFAAVTYFDGQGFLAPKALGLASAEELSGARICVQSGTASEANLADFFRARGLKYRPVVSASEQDARNAYQGEACDAFSADISALASARSVMNSPNAHEILPNVISKEPLGPVVREGDDGWTDIVRWTVYAVILAEELGLSSRTVEEAKATASDPETRRLLGLEGDLGPKLGLSQDWAYQAIRQVGAYHEIFRKNLGADSPLKLDRGLNALWNAPKPGLLYAPPMR